MVPADQPIPAGSIGGEADLVLGRHPAHRASTTPQPSRGSTTTMKRIRLFSLALLPVAFAQCAPSGCAPVAPAPIAPTDPAPVAPLPPSDCNPNYDGCVPNDPIDVDCAGGQGDGPSYLVGTVNVIGSDVYGLDRDDNRIACD
jgi:hypothetical protein